MKLLLYFLAVDRHVTNTRPVGFELSNLAPTRGDPDI